MQVRDSYHQNFRCGWFVNNAVGKPLHLTAANRAPKGVPCQREIANAADGVPRLIPKFLSEANALGVVITDCFDEFALCR